MKKLIITLALISFLMPALPVFADDEEGNRRISRTRYEDLNPDDPVLEDVYVKLYLYRYERHLSLVEQQKQNVTYAQADARRMTLLLERNAIAREEYEESIRTAEVAVLELKELETQVLEAGVMLDIAVDRVSIGLEMPICVEIR